jgi:hypothetical protein
MVASAGDFFKRHRIGGLQIRARRALRRRLASGGFAGSEREISGLRRENRHFAAVQASEAGGEDRRLSAEQVGRPGPLTSDNRP